MITISHKILLIIPAYNESQGIKKTIDKVKNYISESKYNIDYIVINDGSTDDEQEILEENKINNIELINNLGIGGAVQTGYLYAMKSNYDIAVQFDGDGQHDIESLNNLIDPIIKNQADFTVGSRFIEDSTSDFKSSIARQLGIKLLSSLIKSLTKFEIKDVTSGYRAANQKVIKQFVERYPSKYPEPESYIYLLANNIRVKEVGVKMFERETGTSSISLRDSVSYMINVSLSIILGYFIQKNMNKNK